jgi:hypothetical protein
MKNKTLLLIFLALLGIFLISQYAFEKKTRSFKTELIQLDTASITSILLYPKSDNQEEIILNREGNNWVATKGNVITKANVGAVQSILRNLSLIKTKRVAAKNPEKWTDYEVEEGNGSRIKAYAGEKLLEDFIVGRFSFNQQARTAISYVRLAKGNEVYAVDGFLSMTLGQGFDSYRNKELLRLSKDQLTQISINTLGNTVIHQKLGNQWSANGTPIDSTKMANYLNAIQNLSGNNFADDFDSNQQADLLYKTLSFEGNNIAEPILIKAFRDTTRTPAYFIQSSQNKDGLFASDENGIYKKLFLDIE